MADKKKIIAIVLNVLIQILKIAVAFAGKGRKGGSTIGNGDPYKKDPKENKDVKEKLVEHIKNKTEGNSKKC